MTTSKLEGDLQKECLRWVKSLPEVWVLKVVGSATQASGVPDILMCVNGHFVAVELKRPDGKGRVSDIQKAQIERIQRAGGVAVVVDSFEKFKEVVNDCR
jgi:hypothetical protein